MKVINRLPQAGLVGSLALISWLGMQLVHELGHVLAAYATGGAVPEVIFHPLTVSRTHVQPNPLPFVVAWAGPLFGAFIPALVGGAARLTRLPGRRYLNFFAGFCLIANGVYIGAGAIEGAGDAGDLLRQGAPIAVLIAFGAIAFGAGLWIWHCASAEFGLGRSPRSIGAKEAAVAAGVAVVVIVCASIFGKR